MRSFSLIIKANLRNQKYLFVLILNNFLVNQEFFVWSTPCAHSTLRWTVWVRISVLKVEQETWQCVQFVTSSVNTGNSKIHAFSLSSLTSSTTRRPYSSPCSCPSGPPCSWSYGRGNRRYCSGSGILQRMIPWRIQNTCPLTQARYGIVKSV